MQTFYEIFNGIINVIAKIKVDDTNVLSIFLASIGLGIVARLVIKIIFGLGKERGGKEDD